MIYFVVADKPRVPRVCTRCAANRRCRCGAGSSVCCCAANRKTTWRNGSGSWCRTTRCRRRRRAKNTRTANGLTTGYAPPNTRCCRSCPATSSNSSTVWPICISYLSCCWTGCRRSTLSARRSPCFRCCLCWGWQRLKTCSRTGADMRATRG